MTLPKKVYLGPLAVLLAGLLTVAAIILAVGLVGGLVINWIFPSFGLGVSSILTLAILAVMVQFLAIFLGIQGLGSFHHLRNGDSMDDDSEDEDYEPELLSEEQVEYVADQLSEAVVMRLLAVSQNQSPPRPKHRSRR